MTDVLEVQTDAEGESDPAFPMLDAEQMRRVAAYGTIRPIRRGELLVDAGDHDVPFYLVTGGTIEIRRPVGESEELVAVHGAGHFTGEANMLSGRRALVRIRVTGDGEVVEMDRATLRRLVQTESEIGEILLRAFILRRVRLVERGMGDVVLIGSVHCAGTLRVKEFLTRNGHPYSYLDLERDDGVQALMDGFEVDERDIPVLICRGRVALRNPTNQEVADCLGFNDSIDATQLRDVIVVGSGPAGLAAAVYAASEGLDVLVLEPESPGGQAGSSSRIENYLGFPTGISGSELAGRAYAQAQKFGAQILIARGAQAISCARLPYSLDIGDERGVPARTVIIATGAKYRRPPCSHLTRFEGAGIYYAATALEGSLCSGEEVAIVGGGNSAGQAAVYLAGVARHVHMIVRSDGLAESMSRYLIRRIEGTPNITLRVNTELIYAEGDSHLESVRLIDRLTDEVTERSLRHVFIMTGADPSTEWLDGCLVLDERGFIKTGSDLTPEELQDAEWPLARGPYLLETSLPGVFAVGDVRSGSVKRVASAVGEGAVAVSFVHRVLQE